MREQFLNYNAYEIRKERSIEGIFAAGDCTNTLYRQAVVAAGSGAKAGIEAASFVNLAK